MDRAIREIITPVVDRSVTIACMTTRELVMKVCPSVYVQNLQDLLKISTLCNRLFMSVLHTWGVFIFVCYLKDESLRKQMTNLFPWLSHTSDLVVWNPGLCYGGRWKSDTQFSWPDGGQSGRELGSCDLQGWQSFFLSAFTHVLKIRVFLDAVKALHLLEIFGNMILMLLIVLSFRSKFRHFDCLVYHGCWVSGTYLSTHLYVHNVS